MQEPIIYLYGTDQRQTQLGNDLENSGYQVVFSDNTELHIQENTPYLLAYDENGLPMEVLLFPTCPDKEQLNQIIPFLHKGNCLIGGSFSEDFINCATQAGAKVFNYMSSESIRKKNAVLTAEGAIFEAIQASQYSLYQSSCLVIGYGYCGTELATSLSGLRAEVHILTEQEYDRKRAVTDGFQLHTNSYPSYNFIFNTAPAAVITKEIIDQLSKDCCIIDIASAPGGTDFSYCKEKNITAKLCPGLPGKYSSKTAAKILLPEILEFIKQSY